MAERLKRLENVDIGDTLRLITENGDMIQGFVKKMDSGSVVLSHEHPKNKMSFSYTAFPYLTQGNRRYLLGVFSGYAVINKGERKE